MSFSGTTAVGETRFWEKRVFPECATGDSLLRFGVSKTCTQPTQGATFSGCLVRLQAPGNPHTVSGIDHFYIPAKEFQEQGTPEPQAPPEAMLKRRVPRPGAFNSCGGHA